LVVTSDHGEGLGDHGEDEHHLFVYDSTIKVPLILEGGGLPKGSRVRGQFRGIDLMPTVLELAGVERPRVTGVSRAVNLRTGAVIPDNESYAESLYGSIHFGYAPVRALRVEGFKYIDTPKAELYRVATDPEEGVNLAAARAPLAGALRRRLRELHGEDAGSVGTTGSLDPAAIERLAALGYVGGTAPPPRVAGSVLPDPKDRVDHYHRYARAVNAALLARRRGEPPAVVAALQPVAREFASHYSVVSFMGEALLEMRRFTEALPYLIRARDLSPKAGPVWGRLAEAFAGAGRAAEASNAVDQGLKVSPRSTDLIRLRVASLMRAGRTAEGAAFLDQAIRANPRDGLLHAELASLRRNSGDLAAADAASARAVELSPSKGDAWVSRGLVLAALDRSAEAMAALERARGLEASNADAWFYAAVLELRGGNNAAALELLVRAEALDPSRPGLREVRAAAQSGRPAPSAAATPAPGAVPLRLIRLRTRAAAEEALRRVTAGEDFALVARASSLDASAVKGGDLGFVVVSDLGEPLRSAVATLSRGQISAVIETPRGFVLVKREP
jgi:tetratricopeptide (TPR) repeat protein